MDECKKEKMLDDHEDRIRELETSSVRLLERLDNLIKSVNSLVSGLRAVLVGGGTALVGFFIWYVQNR